MYTKEILTDREYQILKAKYDTYHAARNTLCKHPNCVTPEERKILPESPTSEEISQLEVYDFINNPPQKYFAYVEFKKDEQGYYHRSITTWTGEFLGTVYDWNYYKSNFGDWRVSINVRAINGKKYYGTFYKSAGDYCRITMNKGQ